jgi:hypothetical protein
MILCDEFSVALFTCEWRNREGLHDLLIYLPSPKAEVSLMDGWVPSMYSQMGVSASGQYVQMG